MPITYGPGAALPTPGTSAYAAAQSGSGYVSAGRQSSGGGGSSGGGSSGGGGGSASTTSFPTLTKGGQQATPGAGTTQAQYDAAIAAGWTPLAGATTPSTPKTTPATTPAGGTTTPSGTPTVPTTPTPGQAATPSNTPGGTEAPGGTDTLLSQNPEFASLMGNAADAEKYLTSGGIDPNFENALFNKYSAEAAPSIQATEDAFNAQIKTTEDAAAGGQGALVGQMIASGITNQAGTYLGKSEELTADKVNEIIANKGKAVTDILTQVRKDAETNAPILAQNAVNAVKSLSENFISWQGFKASFPEEYNNIVQAMGGENAAAALYTIQAPQATEIQHYTHGSSYVQITKDPISGAIHSSTFDLGFTPPANWTFQKVGTQGLLAFDPATYNPADPSTFKYYDATSGLQCSTTINRCFKYSR